MFMIFVAWGVSALLWTPWIIAWPYIEGRRTVPDDRCYIQFLQTNQSLTIVTAVAAFYLPVVIMAVLFCMIYRETQKRQKGLAELQGGSAVVRGLASSVAIPLLPRMFSKTSTTTDESISRSRSGEDKEEGDVVERSPLTNHVRHRPLSLPSLKGLCRCRCDSLSPDCHPSSRLCCRKHGARNQTCVASRMDGEAATTSEEQNYDDFEMVESRCKATFTKAGTRGPERAPKSLYSCRWVMQRDQRGKTTTTGKHHRGMYELMTPVKSSTTSSTVSYSPQRDASSGGGQSDDVPQVTIGESPSFDPNQPSSMLNRGDSHNTARETDIHGQQNLPTAKKQEPTQTGTVASDEQQKTQSDCTIQERETRTETDDLPANQEIKESEGKTDSVSEHEIVKDESPENRDIETKSETEKGGGGEIREDEGVIPRTGSGSNSVRRPAISMQRVVIQACAAARLTQAVRTYRERKQRQEKKQEKKAAKTLSAILLAFILTWTPYNVFTVVQAFCSDCIPPTLYNIGEYSRT